MGPLSYGFNDFSPISEQSTDLQRLRPSLATLRVPVSHYGRKGMPESSSPVPGVGYCGSALGSSWEDDSGAMSMDCSRSSEDLEFEDLFEDASPTRDHGAQSAPCEQRSLYADKKAVVSSIIASQTRFCDQLRNDVELLTACQLSGSKEVDCHQLAQDLWQLKGYNVRVCETRGSCFCLGAHKHVFLEVCASPADERSFEEVLVVEPFLRQQLEVARPSMEYSQLLDTLPKVFVGTTSRLLQLVNVVVTAMLKSLKQEGMMVPPWRSKQAIMAKWSSVPRCRCGKTSVGIRKEVLHVQGRYLTKYEQLITCSSRRQC
eukprot:jgi/Mesvir1/6540/Mv16801-RA.1